MGLAASSSGRKTSAAARKTPLKPKLREHYLCSGRMVVVAIGSVIRALGGNHAQLLFRQCLFQKQFPLISYFWVNKNGSWVMTDNQDED